MADDVFETQFPIACARRGVAYLDARNKILILALDQRARQQTERALKQAATAGTDWETDLTVEILLGWLNEKETFLQADAYVRGEFSRPAPLPGFTVRHRAEAVAELGSAVVPRVLERLWKSGEFADDTELGALFGALERLEDRRAVTPMIALLEDPASSAEMQGSAAGVLSVIGDPRGVEPVMRLATNRAADPAARVPAIRSLGRFDEPRASQALGEILRRDDIALEERRAAADGLLTRADPATRPVVTTVLETEQDRLIRLTLISVLGRIGTLADIPALRRLAAGSPQLKPTVDDAVEDIQTRAARP